MTSLDFYGRALRRIRVLTIAVGVTGAVVVLVKQGPGEAAGFLVGAALSTVNFYGVSFMANALGGWGRSGPVAAVLIALRYVLIGGVAYVIVRLLGITPLVVLWGFLAAFAAVILEILYELIFRIHE